MIYSDTDLKYVLLTFKRIAVVGLSSSPDRASYGVSKYMQGQGYEITPIRPENKTILGVSSKQSLRDVPNPLEIVNVFRKNDAVPALVEEAILCGAKVLWLQEGVYHQESEKKAREAGIIVFSDLCILKEHVRLLGKR